MSIYGPTRLIIINSGSYDYGEVELIKPLHIIGPNNVGKTSLIAALQFLYIDNEKYMHFSKGPEETKRYYFPTPNSYILFECLTPTGFRVVGVHGLGPMKSFGFQRFSYMGQFDSLDYMDESGKLRDNKDIKGLLSNREYRLMEPHHLRAALTGSGENAGVRLDLVPTRNTDTYRRFQRVFSHLLRLSHISQDDLKQCFYEIYESEFRQKNINIQSDFSSEFEKVKKLADEVRVLQQSSGDIESVLSMATERNTLRGSLPCLFDAIEQSSKQEIARLNEECKNMTIQVEDLKNKDKKADEEYSLKDKEKIQLVQQSAIFKHEIQQYEQLSEELKNYIPDMEAAKIVNIRSQIEEIGFSLINAGQDSVAKVSGRIKASEKLLMEKRELLDGISHTTAIKLKELCGEVALSQAFRVMNHKILGLRVGQGGLSIHDENSLKKNIHAIADRITDNTYVDDAVTMSLAQLDSPLLAQYTDPAIIEEEIKNSESMLERDKKILKDAEETEKLSATKKTLEKELLGCLDRGRRFKEFTDKQPQAKEWMINYKQLEISIVEYSERLTALRKLQRAIDGEINQIEERMKQTISSEKRYVEAIRSLPRPEDSWAGDPETTKPIPAQLNNMITEYRSLFEQQDTFDIKLKNKLIVIDNRTFQRFTGNTEEETLSQLQEEIKALPQKEDLATRHWSGLASSLQGSIKSILGDLDKLRLKIEELNRQIAKIPVSNLQKLRLVLIDRPDVVPMLKKVMKQQETPLFAVTEDASEAYGFIGEFLRRTGEINLLQLFDLSFMITTADGKESVYHKLENIESNGTTITIKVLINLLLLKGLLDDRGSVNIPYYLDEATSLDQENARSIVKLSRDLGFIPILASPEAMDVADNLYFLKHNNEKLVIDRNSLVQINREESGEIDGQQYSY